MQVQHHAQEAFQEHRSFHGWMSNISAWLFFHAAANISTDKIKIHSWESSTRSKQVSTMPRSDVQSQQRLQEMDMRWNELFCCDLSNLQSNLHDKSSIAESTDRSAPLATKQQAFWIFYFVNVLGLHHVRDENDSNDFVVVFSLSTWCALGWIVHVSLPCLFVCSMCISSNLI